MPAYRQEKLNNKYMDQTIASLLKHFKDSYEIANLEDNDAFERFCAFCYLNQERVNSGDFEKTITGEGEEGIDSLAIIINDSTIAEDKDDVIQAVDEDDILRVQYIFIQAKTSESVDYGDVLKFTSRVEQFFDPNKDIGSCSIIKNGREIHREIIRNSPVLEKPEIKAFYITTSKHTPNPTDASARAMNDLHQALEQMDCFSTIKCACINKHEIRDLYQLATRGTEATITIVNKITVPPLVDEVKDAYLALVSGEEFLKILEDTNSAEIKPSIFENNIRDFQGKNIVNDGIASTIQGATKELFPLLNNGVTIIARELKLISTSFTLKDYQIVNGAQTSNILFNNKSYIIDNPNFYIPVRIIETTNEDIIANIVTATNSQTEVPADQLNALNKTERDVETFFQGQDKNLWYERRAKQYDSNPRVIKARVIDRSTLIRATAAIFTDDAHSALGFPKSLRVNRLSSTPATGETFLNNNHEAIIYYAAASAHYRLDLLFKAGGIDVRFKPARWHILMGSRYLISSDPPPPFDSKKVRAWSQKIIDIVWDDKRGNQIFKKVAKIIEQEGLDLSRSYFRTVPSDKAVINACKQDK